MQSQARPRSGRYLRHLRPLGRDSSCNYCCCTSSLQIAALHDDRIAVPSSPPVAALGVCMRLIMLIQVQANILCSPIVWPAFNFLLVRPDVCRTVVHFQTWKTADSNWTACIVNWTVHLIALVQCCATLNVFSWRSSVAMIKELWLPV